MAAAGNFEVQDFARCRAGRNLELHHCQRHRAAQEKQPQSKGAVVGPNTVHPVPRRGGPGLKVIPSHGTPIQRCGGQSKGSLKLRGPRPKAVQRNGAPVQRRSKAQEARSKDGPKLRGPGPKAVQRTGARSKGGPKKRGPRSKGCPRFFGQHLDMAPWALDRLWTGAPVSLGRLWTAFGPGPPFRWTTFGLGPLFFGPPSDRGTHFFGGPCLWLVGRGGAELTVSISVRYPSAVELNPA